MAYGQVRTSSGRVLNLAPEGWINNEGENLNAAPMNGLVAAMQQPQAQQPAMQQPGTNRLAQVASAPDLSDFLTANGTSMKNAVDYNGKKAFRVADGVVWQNPDGSTGKATIQNPQQEAYDAKQRVAAKEQLAMDATRAQMEHTKAQTSALQQPGDKWELQKTDDGIIRVNKSTGVAEPVKMGGQAFGGGLGKKEADATDVLALAAEAEKILPNAHGSGIGNAIGGLANFVGVGNDKNNADAQLKVIAGSLVSKMPKMSGPQSDKDVMLYKEMAGQVGDSTLPIESRLAALETVKKINAKHVTQQAQPAGGYADQAKEQRYQQWLKSQGR